eukprot:CAMPEP_0197178138 /NCGR_PEP_ID=MMETSP1423-20130617/3513_1 /TAXON_ID=476441 /ORGANISM="Pseudo-nitzschia heimii, Strain UNC1101" /LENGTH=303 /DNA_ID=CAMNT_0042627815 /DNA_START=152 /DNA_END=1063 /DNA_ORIENTATION=-
MCKPDSVPVAKGAMMRASSTNVPPVVPSGFARRRIPIAAALSGLAIFYNLTVWLFRDSGEWLRPADEFCADAVVVEPDRSCSRSDLFAKQSASAIAQVYLGGMGLLAWHVTRRAVTGIPQTPEGRLFGYLEEADKVNVAIVVYQTFDFFASLTVPEHNQTVFLAHHMLTAITGLMSLEYQMVHYYAIFFGGCSEISTIFLVLIDFDNYFPVEDRESTWGMIITLCQAAFTLTFVYYRVIAWWMVSFRMWSDVIHVAKKGVIDDYRPGKAWFLYTFLVMDVLLGSLQLFWFFFGILPKILEMFQ